MKNCNYCGQHSSSLNKAGTQSGDIVKFCDQCADQYQLTRVSTGDKLLSAAAVVAVVTILAISLF